MGPTFLTTIFYKTKKNNGSESSKIESEHVGKKLICYLELQTKLRYVAENKKNKNKISNFSKKDSFMDKNISILHDLSASLSGNKDAYYHDSVKKKLKEQFEFTDEDAEKHIAELVKTMCIKRYDDHLDVLLVMRYENMDLNSSYKALRTFYDILYKHVIEKEKDNHKLDTFCYIDDMENVIELFPKLVESKNAKDEKTIIYALCTSILMKRFQIARHLIHNGKWSSDLSWTKTFLHLLILLPEETTEETTEIMEIFKDIFDVMFPKSSVERSIMEDVPILNDTLGYAIVHGKIDMVLYLLKNYPKLDPYGTFHEELYTFFEVAFCEKNERAIRWILEAHSDALLILDINNIFCDYDDETCIPVLDLLFGQYPALQRKAHRILENAIGKNNEKLIYYLFEKVSKMKISPECILSRLCNLSQSTLEILFKKIPDLNNMLHRCKSDDLISMTACLYSHDNVGLIQYFKMHFPLLLQYHEEKIVHLLKICLSNDALNASKILIEDKIIDVKNVLSDTLRNWSFHSSYDVTDKFYFKFKTQSTCDEKKKIVMYLVELVGKKCPESFREILCGNNRLLWDEMEYFIDIYEMEDLDAKQSILTESLISHFSEQCDQYIGGYDIKNMDEVLRKYNVRLPANIMDKYMKRFQFSANELEILHKLQNS